MSRRISAAVILLVVLAAALPVFAAEPVTLRWEPIPGAASYEVEIAADRDFSAIVEKPVTSATRLKWTPPDARAYWWRVRGLDVDGRPGEFSAPGLTGTAPAAVVLDSPKEGARFSVGERVSLRWRAAEGVTRYRVEVAKDAAFSKGVTSTEVTVPEWTFERPAAGTWHWRVLAVDAADRVGTRSAPRTFRVKKAAIVAVAPTPTPTPTPNPTPTPTPIPTSAPAPAKPFVVAGGARLGLFHNFGEVTSPLPAIEVSVKRSRLRAALQAGHYSARTSPSASGVTVRSSLVAIPVAALATFDQPIGRGAAYAGGGLSATMFDGAVSAPGQPTQHSRSLTPGALLVAGYGQPLGRMEVSAEASWSLGPRTDGLVEASASGVSVSVGIRVPFTGWGRR